PGFFQRIEIGDRGAALHDARFLDHAGFKQQRFSERGLAGAALPNKRNRADVSGGVIRHAASLLVSFRSIIPARPAGSPGPRKVPGTTARGGFRGADAVVIKEQSECSLVTRALAQ